MNIKLNTSPSTEYKLPSICLALIHNNDEARNAVIRPCLEALKHKLQKNYFVEIVEISYQPEIVKDQSTELRAQSNGSLIPHSSYMALKRELTYQVLEYQWGKYRALKDASFTRMLGSIFRLLKEYAIGRNNRIKRWKRASAIEVIVTDKHLRAWDRFLDSKADILICFEDDAIFKKDSEENLLKIIERIELIEKITYVNLAGGCPLSSLRINKLEEKKEDFLTFYKKPVTNTSCAYLMNRFTAQCFKSMLMNNPSYRLIGIDWVFNLFFMKLEKTKLETVCFHADPPALNHGSVTGEFKAWQR